MSENLSLKCVMWDDDVISRDNYVTTFKTAAILDLPPWILRKLPTTTEKYSKTIKKVPKISKTVKTAALKLIFINKKTKITNLVEHVCQNVVAMTISCSRLNNLSYQIILR